MTDRQAFEAWCKTKGAPFYYDILPADFSESVWMIWQAAKATGPQWHDAPTVPGLWTAQDMKGNYTITSTGSDDEVFSPHARYYGPIPEDKP